MQGQRPSANEFNTAIVACVRAKQFEHVRQLLQMMQGVGVPPNMHTYNAVISHLCLSADWKLALGYVEEAQQRGLEPDVITYANVLTALVRGGQFDRALQIWEQTQQRGLALPLRAKFSIMRALVKTGNAAGAHRVLQSFELQPERLNSLQLSNVAQVLSAAGDCDACMRLLLQCRDTLGVAGVHAPALASALAAFLVGRRWDMILDLWRAYDSHALFATPFGAYAVLHALEARAEFGNALAAAQGFRRAGGGHLGARAAMCMVRQAARQGQPQVALDFLRDARAALEAGECSTVHSPGVRQASLRRTAGYVRQAYTYAVLACCTQGCLPQAQEVLGELEAALPEARHPAPYCFLLAAAGEAAEFALALSTLRRLLALGLLPDNRVAQRLGQCVQEALAGAGAGQREVLAQLAMLLRQHAPAVEVGGASASHGFVDDDVTDGEGSAPRDAGPPVGPAAAAPLGDAQHTASPGALLPGALSPGMRGVLAAIRRSDYVSASRLLLQAPAPVPAPASAPVLSLGGAASPRHDRTQVRADGEARSGDAPVYWQVVLGLGRERRHAVVSRVVEDMLQRAVPFTRAVGFQWLVSLQQLRRPREVVAAFETLLARSLCVNPSPGMVGMALLAAHRCRDLPAALRVVRHMRTHSMALPSSPQAVLVAARACAVLGGEAEARALPQLLDACAQHDAPGAITLFCCALLRMAGWLPDGPLHPSARALLLGPAAAMVEGEPLVPPPPSVHPGDACGVHAPVVQGLVLHGATLLQRAPAAAPLPAVLCMLTSLAGAGQETLAVDAFRACRHPLLAASQWEGGDMLVLGQGDAARAHAGGAAGTAAEEDAHARQLRAHSALLPPSQGVRSLAALPPAAAAQGEAALMRVAAALLARGGEAEAALAARVAVVLGWVRGDGWSVRVTGAESDAVLALKVRVAHELQAHRVQQGPEHAGVSPRALVGACLPARASPPAAAPQRGRRCCPRETWHWT